MEVVRHVKEYWTIYTTFAFIAATWGYASTQLSNHEVRITKIEDRQDLLIEDISLIKQGISSINTSIKYIERNI